MSLCSLSRSDRIATLAFCSGSEGFDVWPGDSLPLHSSSLKRHQWWWQRVNLCCRPVYSPLAINHFPPDSDHIVNGFCVHLSCCSILLTSRALKHLLRTVVSHSQPHSDNGSEEIGLASTFSLNGTNSCVSFVPFYLSNAVRPSRIFWHLDKMLPRMFHQPRQDWEVSSEFFLCAALHVALDGSDDATTSLAFSTNPFEGLSPLTASSNVTSALHFSATRLLNAMHCVTF